MKNKLKFNSKKKNKYLKGGSNPFLTNDNLNENPFLTNDNLNENPGQNPFGVSGPGPEDNGPPPAPGQNPFGDSGPGPEDNGPPPAPGQESNSMPIKSKINILESPNYTENETCNKILLPAISDDEEL